MKPISQLEAERTEKITQAEALSSKPGATAEELAQADALLDQADQLAAEIKTRKSQEHRLSRINAGRAPGAPAAPATLAVTPTEPTGTPALTGNEPRLPAVPKSYGQLKCFKGADGDRLAYAFGCLCLSYDPRMEPSRASHFRNLAAQVAPEMLAHSAQVPTAGGYLTQPTFGPYIQMLMYEYGVMRQYADVEPMGEHEIGNYPVRTAGLSVYPATEGSDRTPSDLTFANVELISRDWAIYSKFSNKLSQLAIVKLGDEIAKDMAYQFSYNEDNCCFNGDGSATYQGIQGIKTKLPAGSVYDAAATHTTFASLTLADYSGVVARLPNYMGMQPRWFISRAAFYTSMQPLAIATGYLDPTMAVTPAFLGFPVTFTEVLPKTTAVSTVIALFGDMRLAAKLGDRDKLEIATSEHAHFQAGQTAVRGETAFAFNAYRVGDASNAGPVVALKTAAS